MDLKPSFDLNSSLSKVQSDKLESLKNTKNRRDEDLKQAAKDFEAVFLNQLLDAMDATIQRSEMFSGGHGEETFRKMYYQEVSKIMAHSPNANFGLGEAVYKQLANMDK